MISNGHPLMRSLIRHNVPHLWCDNVLFWHHMDMSSPPAGSIRAWINGGARQVAFTHSSDSGGKNVYDERLKQVVNVKQNRIGFGCQIEPARKNGVPYNRTFTDWIKRGAVTITTDTETRIDGSGLASKLSNLGDAGANDFYANMISYTADTQLSMSMWIKRVSTSGTIKIIESSGGPNRDGEWNIDLSVLSDGWEYLTDNHSAVTVVQAFKSDTASGAMGLQFYNESGGPLTFYMDLLQLEEGKYPTSSIATEASAVTWTADAMRLINADVFGRMSTGGTLFYCGQSAYAPANHPGHRQPIAINYDNSLAEYAGFQFNAGAGVNGVIRADNATKYDQASGVAYSPSSPSAAALVWDGARTELYVNGAIGNQSSAINAFPELDRLEVGRRVTADENFGGDSFAILCFDRALTERECIQLTKNPEVWKWGA